MRKAILIATVFSIGFVLSATSCKRMYRCSCSFNNKIMFAKDLGAQSEAKAQEICSQFDTTVTGEVWNCTIY